MRKLSETQIKALQEIANGSAYAPNARTGTLASLVGRGLITPLCPATGHQLTEAGRKELGLPPVILADPAPGFDHEGNRVYSSAKDEYTDTAARFNPEVIDQVHGYALTLNTQDPEDIREGTSITSDGAQAAQTNPDYRELPSGTDRQVAKAEHFAPGSGILVPRFEAPRLNVTHGHRPASAVQGDWDLLAQTHGADRADEILDTWTIRENRSDRRNGARLDKVEGRRVMRLRRTPSRRRFTTQAALIRKAERRAARVQVA